MVSIKSLSVFLAVATAVVTGLPSNDHRDDGEKLSDREVIETETVVFKRDATSVLTPRDLELAEMHGVDLQQMWKHSVIKRSDGDDYTIWVHNSFKEDTEINTSDDPSIQKRGLLKTLNKYIPWRENLSTARGCPSSFITYNDDTGPNAPFTGGIQTMRDWAGRTWGHWEVNTPSTANGVWLTLVIAGSNSGFNAMFQVSPPQARRAHPDSKVGAVIGTHDIQILARETNTRYARKFGTSWRARGWGTMSCTPEDFPPAGDNLTYWRITNTAEKIDPKAGIEV